MIVGYCDSPLMTGYVISLMGLYYPKNDNLVKVLLTTQFYLDEISLKL